MFDPTQYEGVLFCFTFHIHVLVNISIYTHKVVLMVSYMTKTIHLKPQRRYFYAPGMEFGGI